MALLRHFRKDTVSEQSTSEPVEYRQISNREQFRRAVSALAQHKPHKLPNIPELSGSSRATLLQRYVFSDHVQALDGLNDPQNHVTIPAPLHQNDAAISSASDQLGGESFAQSTSCLSDIKSIAPSALSLPLHDIPKRRSSMVALSQTLPPSRRASLQDLHSDTIHAQKAPNTNGHADSPVRHALEQGVQSSEVLRTSPSRTFIRTTSPFNFLDTKADTHHPRLEMFVRLPSPLFVGGGTVEGQIELRIDVNSGKKTRSEPLLISRLSVDVIGVEEVEDGRRWVFLSLATELFNSRHPPPPTMVWSQTPEKGSELYWRTQPATTTIPFRVHLPLKLGPPPYTSRQASIRYLLCPSVAIKVGDKRSAVRQVWSIQMLTIHDPEKALANLPSPLLATDTLVLSHNPVVDYVKLTAGLHRQIWVSGSVIFTDIHIVNSTEKQLKRLDVNLEKSVLWFSHAAAGTAEQRGNNLRLPAKVDTEMVSKSLMKQGKEWTGVATKGAEVRTCELEIPKGHVTIGNGRYFEVRYFVKVTVMVARGKTVSVRLPVTIIHINSLDIMPNSLAQVAASIEAKRSMVLSSNKAVALHQTYAQGGAFAAARRQSSKRLEPRLESKAEETLRQLTQDIDNSPRHADKQTGTRFIGNLSPNETNANRQSSSGSCYHHPLPSPSCYHCHLLHTKVAYKASPKPGPKLPRLQVSTSGLGFSESEFEMPPDLPRKVMLSEKERQMINQERELRLQRQWSQRSSERRLDSQKDNIDTEFAVWKNVAMPLAPSTSKRDTSIRQQYRPVRQYSQRRPTGTHAYRNSLPLSMSQTSRSRSGANLERMRGNFSDNIPTKESRSKVVQGLRSIDQGYRHQQSGYSPFDDDVFGPRRTSHENRAGPA